MKFQKNQLIPSVLILSMLLILCHITPAQRAAVESAPSIAEKVRIARLVGLAKVWGTVKFFHPYLAYREIDWDKALVETIPKVNAAKTPEEYKSAINFMLSFVNDKNTFAETKAEGKKNNSDAKKEPLRTEDRKSVV